MQHHVAFFAPATARNECRSSIDPFDLELRSAHLTSLELQNSPSSSVMASGIPQEDLDNFVSFTGADYDTAATFLKVLHTMFSSKSSCFFAQQLMLVLRD